MGDIINLGAGDVVPGDNLLLEIKNLVINEAALTGDTLPVEKTTGAPLLAATPLAKRVNSLFMGTSVSNGTAVALVVATGKDTEFGRVSETLSHRPPETEFERGLRRFGYLLMEVTLLLTMCVFAVNVYLHRPVMPIFLFRREPTIDNMTRRRLGKLPLRTAIWEAITAASHRPVRPDEVCVEEQGNATRP